MSSLRVTVVTGTNGSQHSHHSSAHDPSSISRKLDTSKQSAKLPTRRRPTTDNRGRDSRRQHGQKRANQWKTSRPSIALRRKYAELRRGWKSFKEKLKPTHAELCSRIQCQSQDEHQGRGMHIAPTQHYTTWDTAHDRDLYLMSEYLRDGGRGFMPERKEDGWIRIGFENWNGLGLFNQRWKLDRLNTYARQLSVDIIAGCEVQTDWTFLPPDQRLSDIICPEQSVRCSYAHNSNERISREQVGGTAIAAIGKVSEMVTTTGVDETGLGRWSWLSLGDGSVRTYIVSAYFPHIAPRSSKGNTAHDQQRRYFEGKGNFTPPQRQFEIDLLATLRTWRITGAKVILAIDANQDVYNGPLSRALSKDPFNLECMFLPAMGQPVPNSHFRGTAPITTIFGSPGLTSGNAMCYPHWFGIGDHRLFLLEVTAESVFGGRLPTICRPKSRQLNSRIPRICQQYTTRLRALCNEHKMQEKLDSIIWSSVSGQATTEMIQWEHDMWDVQFGQFMAAAEKDSIKFKSCLIEHSPKVGKLLRRRQVIHWLIRYLDGKKCNKGNLSRACKTHGIEQPFSTSMVEAERILQETTAELHQLAPQAEALRKEHLKHRLEVAKEDGNDDTVREIIRIIRREGAKKRQRMINHIVRPRQGRAVTEVSETTARGEVVHDNESSIISAVGKRLSERFRLGTRAPSTTDHEIASIVGIMGDTSTAQEILDGSYTFPHSWDQPTVMLMQEAAQVKTEMTQIDAGTNGPITPLEFSAYWRTAKEDISSSYSGRHFGHYKAASKDESLSLLHTTSMNLAAQRGIPITRWRHGVTVLLEKIPGNNSIDRLRAICLLEADFNWWLKMIFTRRMMSRMHRNGMVPVEQVATSGKTSIDGVMMKQFFYDRANVMHESASLSSTDAANCYDAVNHPICSLALQAFGVSVAFIRNYLASLQTMQFHLRTGFGLSDESFGGSTTQPFMGLTQGSGASPPVWTAVSTLIVRAYRRQGHGPCLRSMWSNLVIILAAILFVDDTDLLHLCHNPDATEEEFVEMIQRATRLWTLLLQATGGNLKPQKCYWYLMSFRYDNGVPRLKKLSELKHLELQIPQHGEREVPITLLDVNKASKTLGVFTCPSGDCTQQLIKLRDKGQDWARRVGSSSLSPRLVWHSFHLQLMPSIRYGLVPIMAYPRELLQAFDKVYYKILPSLGLNRHIRREWRTLPTQYQGLGMPDLAVEKTALSIQFLQRHWGKSTAMGIQLLQAYEFLQLETGLGGHVINRDFQRYGILATHSWFKILWSYLDFFKLDVNLGEEYAHHPPRERDQHFMDIVVERLPRDEWTAINRVRKYKQVYFLSHILYADGTTVNTEMLTTAPGPSRGRISFPREEPTRSDFRLWHEAIALITSPTHRYSPPLGAYIFSPMESDLWLATHQDTSTLFRRRENQDGEMQWDEYTRASSSMSTRRSTRYCFRRQHFEQPLPPLDTVDVVSVVHADDGTVSAHSRVIWDLRSPVKSTKTLHDYLEALGPSPLWNHVTYDDDGLWIRQALAGGSLLIVHDGSYMSAFSPDMCSAGGVITCTKTRRTATFSWCEQSSTHIADNYRGELLGGMIALLILRGATTIPSEEGFQLVQIYCDNSGVVSHGHDFRRSLPEKQSHADILRLFRQTLEFLPFPIDYQHLYGHQDDTMTFAALPLPAQMNVIADSIAKDALIRGKNRSTQNNTMYYPGETATVTYRLTSRKITSSLRTAISLNWGSIVCQQLLVDRGQLSDSDLFHVIHWDSVHRAMDRLPRMYQVWITKHISHFCGTNLQLWRMRHSGVTSPLCPCCNATEETNKHILRCPDEGRTTLYNSMVDNLETWLLDNFMDMDLAFGLGEYLRARGDKSMTSILGHATTYSSFAKTHDNLGWDNFLSGRLSSVLVRVQHEALTRVGRAHAIQRWCTSFIHKLLDLSHRQWLYRNLRVHLEKRDNMTQGEHEKILHQVEGALATDPATLLPQYRHLLHTAFYELGAASSHTRQVWLAEMSTAKRASALQAGKRKRGLEVTQRPNLAKKARLPTPTLPSVE